MRRARFEAGLKGNREALKGKELLHREWEQAGLAHTSYAKSLMRQIQKLRQYLRHRVGDFEE